jgi:porphobilinogen synthase
MYRPDPARVIHSSFGHEVLREIHSQHASISPSNLMLPLFITNSSPDAIEEIGSLKGVCRYGINKILDFVEPLVSGLGLRSVLIFGVDVHSPKDGRGSAALLEDGPCIQAIKLLKAALPQLLIAADVCLCPYSNTGHCSIFTDEGHMDNQSSIEQLADIALAYANAGADVIAPSDMMDGRIGAIKARLTKSGFGSRVSVLSYSAKFCSGFYGPFRDAAGSAPKFGDRRNYQLPPPSRSLALRCVDRDVAEGADMLMVKPAGSYLDIIRDVKNRHPEYPLAAYQVSGEYAMLMKSADAGIIDLKRGVFEAVQSIRRAGCDIVISYFTPKILHWIDQDEKEKRKLKNS